MQGFTVPLSSLSSWFTGEHVKDKRAAIARLIKSLAKQQTPGSSFSFPDLGFGEAEMEEPSDLKTPQKIKINLKTATVEAAKEGDASHEQAAKRTSNDVSVDAESPKKAKLDSLG